MLILRHFLFSFMRNAFTSYAFFAQKKSRSRLKSNAADRIRTCKPFRTGSFQDYGSRHLINCSKTKRGGFEPSNLQCGNLRIRMLSGKPR